MRLAFDFEEGEGFEQAKASLLASLETWLLGRSGLSADETDETVGNAALALDWKWGYGDGHLARWRTSDVAEFLLEWCPRKLSVPQQRCHGVPVGLARLVEFLDMAAMLDAGSSPPPQLLETIDALTGEFIEAMGDSSQFGMAKSLFGAAASEGFDVTDPADIEQWMAEFNARPEQERRRILPDSALGTRRRRPKLPPVAMPSEEEVAASGAAAAILETFRRLAQHVGDGRRLTQRGNLTLADARALIELLGTGDVMDDKIGDRTFKTKSSAELPRLRHVLRGPRRPASSGYAAGRLSPPSEPRSWTVIPSPPSTEPPRRSSPWAPWPPSATPTAGSPGRRSTSSSTARPCTVSAGPPWRSGRFRSTMLRRSQLTPYWGRSAFRLYLTSR
jgi:hypothetical protein